VLLTWVRRSLDAVRRPFRTIPAESLDRFRESAARRAHADLKTTCAQEWSDSVKRNGRP